MTMNVHFAYADKGFLSSKQLRGRMLAALTNSQNRIHEYLKEYTSTWNHPVVWYFNKATTYKFGDISVWVRTDDDIFRYLEEGTRERYAIMDVGFQPKTSHRTIKSQAGQGGKAYMSPLPTDGIEAREVLQEIAKVDFPKFQQDVLRVTANISFFPPQGTLP